MGIFLRSQKKEEPVLLFDLGSTAVSAALFYPAGGIPKIIFSVTEDIPVEPKMDPEKFLFLITKALGKVADKTHKSGLSVPGKIYCVLSSPLYFSETRIISMSKNTPFIFNEKLADELLKKEIKFFREEKIKKYPDFDKKLRPIEMKNMRIRLNGYEADAPIGQRAKELEMTMHISLSGEETLRNIEDAIRPYFNERHIKFSTFAMAAFTAVRDMKKDIEDFLLVDAGGEITDIAMVKKNVFQASSSFPAGSHFVLRRLSEELGKNIPEVSSLLSLYTSKHMDSDPALGMSGVLAKLEKEWIKDFENSLVNLTNDISIPSTVFLTADPDFAEFFTEAIKADQLNQYTLSNNKFEVIPLRREALGQIAITAEGVTPVPAILLEAAFISRHFKPSHA